MAQCSSCGEASVITDPSSGFPVCTSCGVLQSTQLLHHQSFDSAGRAHGFLIRSELSYRESKLLRAQQTIDDISSRLGLPPARSALVSRMVSDVTDDEFGAGDWFNVLVAACSHIVMRQHGIPLSIAEAADAVGHDVYNVGRMVSRVIHHLGLAALPEFDVFESLDRALTSCPCLEGLEEEKAEQMARQGRFLLRCCVKWSLATGRHPLPLVAAVITFVADVNGVAVDMNDIAKEMYVTVGTMQLRRKEIEGTLVKAAKALLPWGADVTVKNIVHNAPLLLRYMEIKSKSGSLDLGTFCVMLQADYETDEGRDKIYFRSRHKDGDEFEELQHRKLSADGLLSSMKKAQESYSMIKASDEFGKNNERKRKRGGLVIDAQMSDESKGKISLEQIMATDVGYDELPPSFISGLDARKDRREKIKAAKIRILEVMKPSQQLSSLVKKGVGAPKKQRSGRKKFRDIDWEDCIIELLLLHGVKEEEIEGGQFKRLLDLHVFNSLEPKQ